jgi:YkoY family integral membrane protein
MFLDQTFSPQDLLIVALLVLLEGVLSIDNALVLGLLARRVPKPLQAKALTYGLVGAFVFRVVAIGTAAYLLKWRIVKMLGGGYLVYIAVRHLVVEARQHRHGKVAVGLDGQPVLAGEADQGGGPPNNEHEILARMPAPFPKAVLAPVAGGEACSAYKFWSTVGVIELTDIAFAVDSILAAIALVGAAPPGHTGLHPKLWVVITGGLLGVVLMRFAAVIFIKLLETFPRFETSAYLLVAVIGAKLLIDWYFNVPGAAAHRVNFHDWHRPEFWALWILMLVGFLVGFLPQKKR